MSLLEYTHFRHTSTIMMSVSLDDIPDGLNVATHLYLDLPNITITITWLLRDAFTIVILDMDSAPHVEYSDVVLCGAFAVIKNHPMDGLATISDSMTLLRNLNYKQTHQMKLIWNGFHSIVLRIWEKDMDTCMVYLLVIMLN